MAESSCALLALLRHRDSARPVPRPCGICIGRPSTSDHVRSRTWRPVASNGDRSLYGTRGAPGGHMCHNRWSRARVRTHARTPTHARTSTLPRTHSHTDTRPYGARRHHMYTRRHARHDNLRRGACVCVARSDAPVAAQPVCARNVKAPARHTTLAVGIGGHL